MERHASGMVLTELGTAALRAAEAMERAASALETDPSRVRDDEPRGIVRLTMPPWIAERLIIPALPSLRARHAELELRILGSHELLDIAARAADLALRNVVPARGPLVCLRVGELAGCVYGSTLYLERMGTPCSRDDLSAHDLVAYEGMGGMPGFEWLRDSPHHERIVFRAGDPVGLASAIRSGLGLGAIPCLLGETEPHLRRIDALGVGFSPLYLVVHEELRDAARIRAVARFVTEVLRANEAVLMGHGEPDPTEVG